VPRGVFQFAQLSACSTHAYRARLQQGDAKREELLEKGGTRGASLLTGWIFIFLIIWTQLFHCKYFIYFLPKFMIFFSLQIETWII